MLDLVGLGGAATTPSGRVLYRKNQKHSMFLSEDSGGGEWYHREKVTVVYNPFINSHRAAAV